MCKKTIHKDYRTLNKENFTLTVFAYFNEF
jgi:hypothetical protein